MDVATIFKQYKEEMARIEALSLEEAREELLKTCHALYASMLECARCRQLTENAKLQIDKHDSKPWIDSWYD